MAKFEIIKNKNGAVVNLKRPKSKKSYRVKLLNLADYAQAVWHVRDEKYLELKLYGFDSKSEAVQFVAPFAFETEERRNEVFADDVKLTDFANAVFVTQMATIDPDLNTNNFKNSQDGPREQK